MAFFIKNKGKYFVFNESDTIILGQQIDYKPKIANATSPNAKPLLGYEHVLENPKMQEYSKVLLGSNGFKKLENIGTKMYDNTSKLNDKFDNFIK